MKTGMSQLKLDWLNDPVFSPDTTISPVSLSQIDHYAQTDLKKGLQLFGTEGNVGLTNAWMIVQTDVRYEITGGGGRLCLGTETK